LETDKYAEKRLGAEFSGFFPFGVDQFDNGDYVVRELSREQSGKLMRPFRWSEDTIKLVMVSKTGVSYSAVPSNQGSLYIGDCEYGFMYPPDGIRPKISYCFQTSLSMDGTPSSINGPLVGDSWETNFEIICNTYNAFCLIDQLVNKTRTANIDIVVPDHFDMFGIDQSNYGVGGTYTCKFLGSERMEKEIVLKIIHEGFDRFRIPLSFWMKEKAA
jgi:hypothetical protein